MPFKFNPITHRFDIVQNGGSGSGFIQTLTGDAGGPVGPDGADNINIVGSGPVTITGNSVTNTLTIGSSFPFLTWSVIVADQMAITQQGYFTNGAARVNVTLPNSSVVGDVFVVSAINSNGWKIVQDAGQQIQIGNQTTTLGVAGSVQSIFVGDSLTLVCSVANTNWVASLGFVGNLTVV